MDKINVGNGGTTPQNYLDFFTNIAYQSQLY